MNKGSETLQQAEDYIKAHFPGSYTWSARDPSKGVSALYAVISGRTMVFLSPLNRASADTMAEEITAAGGYAATVTRLADAQAVIEAAGVSAASYDRPVSLKALSQLYYLTHEIEQLEDRLERLRAKANPSISNTTGSARGGKDQHSKVEGLSVEIANLEGIIRQRKREAIAERVRLETYISSIPDSLTRMIFSLRFVECLRWDDVAARIGGNTTVGSVKTCCYRHIGKEQAAAETQM